MIETSVGENKIECPEGNWGRGDYRPTEVNVKAYEQYVLSNKDKTRDETTEKYKNDF